MRTTGAGRKNGMPVVSNGSININGVGISVGPFRTQREVLNSFGINVAYARGGSYQFPGKIMIWFPDCTRSHIHLWRNEFIDDNHIVETLNPENQHSCGIGVGMLLEDSTRIVFAKQGCSRLYYYAGVFVREQGSTYDRNCYVKIFDSFSMDSKIQNGICLRK